MFEMFSPRQVWSGTLRRCHIVGTGSAGAQPFVWATRMLLLTTLALLVCRCDRPHIDRGQNNGPQDYGNTPSDTANSPDLDSDSGSQAMCSDNPLPLAQTFTTDERVQTVLENLTLDEKISQMGGDMVFSEMFKTPDNTKVGIRGFKFRDGPRGVRLEQGGATTYPVAVARAASFDLNLEKRIGAAMGLETKALGHNVLLAPTINTLRHPAWGRGQETYGEDPWYLGQMGIASVQGIQQYVPACVKHFACNNIEDTRMTNNAVVDRQNLRENYTRQFEMTVKRADAACIMGAYNKVNGHYCCENEPLLRTLLKEEWKFDGFVVSDWLATQSTVESALAGLDVEMPWRVFYDKLQMAVSGEQVPVAVIDEAVTRILRVKFKFGFALLSDEFAEDPSVVESDEHVSLALEAAVKGSVLLKNDNGALPLSREKVKKLAVVGPFADVARLGDVGSSDAKPSYSVTPLQGIRTVAGDEVEVLSSQDATAAEGADVAVVVVALTSSEEGEAVFGGGDRDTLEISEDQEALIRQVASKVDTTIVIMEAGGPVTMEDWKDKADAIVMAWYPGMEGGTALGQLLFGDENFTGRTPQTWPVRWEDCPEFGNKLDTTEFEYYHGYRHFDQFDIDPLYPFGYGLSYTTFTYSNLSAPCQTITTHGRLVVSFDVENTGNVSGAAVPQVYIGYPETKVRRPEMEFKGFARVELDPGQKKRVEVVINIEDLAYFDAEKNEWIVEDMSYDLYLGDNQRDLPFKATFAVGPVGEQAMEVVQ